MTAYWLLLLHCLGDYVVQSDWMATEKTKRSLPAFIHVLTYTIPFVFLLGFQWQPLLLIGGTHFVIDRWRLARYVCWVKNFIGPKSTEHFISDPEGKWHKNFSVMGCPVNDEGIPTCTHHPELRARRDVTRWWHPWSECSGTGYHKDRPAWLAVWLMIIADNTMHLFFNGLAWVLWGTGS